MGRLYLVADKAEIDSRRARVDTGVVVEVWQDLHTPDIVWMGDDRTRRVAYGQPREAPPSGLFWLGEDAKQALDAAGAGSLPHLLVVEDAAVSVYYGPRLADVESLPGEASLRARVLSAHGIAVAWITYDQFGARTEYQPSSPADPVFLLRRAGTRVAHRWRLFRTREEAVTWMAEAYGRDSEGAEWARALPVEDLAGLIKRDAL